MLVSWRLCTDDKLCLIIDTVLLDNIKEHFSVTPFNYIQSSILDWHFDHPGAKLVVESAGFTKPAVRANRGGFSIYYATCLGTSCT